MTWLLAFVVGVTVLYLALCCVFGRDFLFLLKVALRKRRMEQTQARRERKILVKVKTQANGA